MKIYLCFLRENCCGPEWDYLEYISTSKRGAQKFLDTHPLSEEQIKDNEGLRTPKWQRYFVPGYPNKEVPYDML